MFRALVRATTARPLRTVNFAALAKPRFLMSAVATKRFSSHWTWTYSNERRSEDDIEVKDVDGLPIAVINGEEVVVPQLEDTLEFTLSSPMDLHTFEESPVIKETPVPGQAHEEEDDE